MKKITLTMIAVVMGLFLTSQVFAWGPGPGKRGGRCQGIAMEKLNLTDDQKAKFETLQTEHFKATEPLWKKIHSTSDELRQLWLKADPDKNKITAKQKEVRTLRDQLEDKRTAYRFEVNKLLTKEQKEKLAGCGWGKKAGFGPRGGKRDMGHQGPGNCLYLP